MGDDRDSCTFKLCSLAGFVSPVANPVCEHQAKDEKVAIFCHHATRGGARRRTLSHEPCHHGGADSSLALRCTVSAPAAWAQITSQGKGDSSRRGKEKHRDPEVVISMVAAELFAKKKTLVSPLALVAKHVCTRMGFKNSDRTLSVFKDLCERFVCPQPKSKHLSIKNTLGYPQTP